MKVQGLDVVQWADILVAGAALSTNYDLALALYDANVVRKYGPRSP